MAAGVHFFLCNLLALRYEGYVCVSFALCTRESDGEDIADTDSQRSNRSDDEYEDSFIDDEEP